MKDFHHAPTKAETIGAIVLCMIGATTCGAGAYFLWNSRAANVGLVVAFLTALVILFAFFFYRASATARRALTPKETRVVARTLIFTGLGGLVLVVLASPRGPLRYMVLGNSLAVMAYGLAELRRRS